MTREILLDEPAAKVLQQARPLGLEHLAANIGTALTSSGALTVRPPRYCFSLNISPPDRSLRFRFAGFKEEGKR